MAEARWLVSLGASDEQAVKEWAARCEQLGAVPPANRGPSVAAAIRLAVKLADSLTDDDVKRGYA
jgi:hypothetical protein